MMTDRPTTFFVPFRSGSKGLPNKNTLDLCGMPIYLHTLKQAISLRQGKVYASTDYRKSQLVGFPKNAVYVERPNRLSTDSSTMTDVLYDFLSNRLRERSIVVLLQVTSPLRQLADIRSAISLYKSGGYDLVMTVTNAESGILKYGISTNEHDFSPIHSIKSCFANRQNLPKVVRPNGMIYVFDSMWFLENSGFETENLGVLNIPVERSIDIDSLEDMAFAEQQLLKLTREDKE